MACREGDEEEIVYIIESGIDIKPEGEILAYFSHFPDQ